MIFLLKDIGFTGYDAVIAFALMTIVYLLAITSHEYAHAYAATKCGDDTARLSGRLTLNPIAHIDLLGALCFLIAGFGWAKPVPINPLKFKKYRSGIAKVSLAGVTANLILCFISSFFYVLFSNILVADNTFSVYTVFFFQFSMIFNALLFVFNLLPIYPLDGFNYLSTKLKPNSKFIQFNARYGYIILLILAATGVINYLLVYVQYIYWPFVKLFELLF
ncbi:MAG: site-2 protease family protein [Clostridia bacterium]|nr:site-2 protease family protein [Clostridia bacterium]